MGKPLDLKLSPAPLDGSVRLRIAELESLLPQHLYSAVDTDPLLETDARRGELQGTTEWMVPLDRRLSFGLDWTFSRPARQMRGRWTLLRTNLTVVDEDDMDWGPDCLRLCVARLMTRADWERVVIAHLDLNA